MLDGIAITKTGVPKYGDLLRYCRVSLLSICNRFIPVYTKLWDTGRFTYFLR